MVEAKSYWQEYFELVSPTWMENWYEDLKNLTIHSSYFRITEVELRAFFKLQDGIDEDNLFKSFIDRLNTHIKTMMNFEGSNKVFVRLGSRSPKDCFFRGVSITEAKDVLTLFNDSERILEDFVLCDNLHYLPYVFIRKWIDIPRDKEFRCFVKDRELKGITQYYYRDRFFYLDSIQERHCIKARAIDLMLEINKKFKLKNYVFDMVYRGNDIALLIEINPFSSWTDPCLFDWAVDKFDEFKFKYLQSLKKLNEVKSANSSQD